MVVPKNTPKWSFLVGKPMVVWYHRFGNPPYRKSMKVCTYVRTYVRTYLRTYVWCMTSRFERAWKMMNLFFSTFLPVMFKKKTCINPIPAPSCANISPVSSLVTRFRSVNNPPVQVVMEMSVLRIMESNLGTPLKSSEPSTSILGGFQPLIFQAFKKHQSTWESSSNRNEKPAPLASWWFQPIWKKISHLDQNYPP